MRVHGQLVSGMGLLLAVAVAAHSGTAGRVAGHEATPQAQLHQLHGAIHDHVLSANPDASAEIFRGFPEVLVAEARRTRIDHCLALAQVEVESRFRHDAVGKAGEIGIFQMLPSTAALIQPLVGPFRPPKRVGRVLADLGNLAEPVIATRFAMAYLRDILDRQPGLREALMEYNGGPRARRPKYFRAVMLAYHRLLEIPELGCRAHELGSLPAATTFRGSV